MPVVELVWEGKKEGGMRGRDGWDGMEDGDVGYGRQGGEGWLARRRTIEKMSAPHRLDM